MVFYLLFVFNYFVLSHTYFTLPLETVKIKVNQDIYLYSRQHLQRQFQNTSDFNYLQPLVKQMEFESSYYDVTPLINPQYEMNNLKTSMITSEVPLKTTELDEIQNNSIVDKQSFTLIEKDFSQETNMEIQQETGSQQEILKQIQNIQSLINSEKDQKSTGSLIRLEKLQQQDVTIMQQQHIRQEIVPENEKQIDSEIQQQIKEILQENIEPKEIQQEIEEQTPEQTQEQVVDQDDKQSEIIENSQLDPQDQDQEEIEPKIIPDQLSENQNKPNESEIIEEKNDNKLIKKVPLDNYYNYQYIGYINVKESDSTIKKFSVIFDSGSSWLWLPGLDCQGCSQSQNGLNCSENCIALKEEIKVNYSIGEITGMVSEAEISLSDNDFHKMRFILVKQANGMEGAQFDGIVGLEIEGQSQLFEWPVGFYLNRGLGSPHKSEINFGGINMNLLRDSQDIKYIPALENWLLNINSVDAQFREQGYKLALNHQLVIDSGSSLIMFPLKLLNEFLRLLEYNEVVCLPPGNSFTSLKCSCPKQELHMFPTLSFHFNDVNVSLEPQFYVQVDPDSPICHLLISPIPSHDDNLIILGNPFMRKYYTLFDRENRRVGLSESINTITSTDSNYQKITNYFILLVSILIMATIIINIVNLIIKHQIDSKIDLRSQVKTCYRMV